VDERAGYLLGPLPGAVDLGDHERLVGGEAQLLSAAGGVGTACAAVAR
jgi:hypothetical protein